jgi:biotin operon repressor
MWAGVVIPEAVIAFIDRCVHSVWALELLLFLRQRNGDAWSLEQLEAELRASRTVVNGVLPQLIASGLVITSDDGRYRYNSAAASDAIIGELDRLYHERPVSIIREITLIPRRRIQRLADAFKIRKD